jgi:hypothetical protein
MPKEVHMQTQHDDDAPVRSSQGTTAATLLLIAAVCAVLSLLLLASSGFGTRLGLWEFRTGFSLLKFSAYCGAGCAVLAVASGILSVRRKSPGWALLSLIVFASGLLVFAVPYSWRVKAQSVPRIHDITTDVDRPPQFLAIQPPTPGRFQYGGATVAAQQLRAYPDIKTAVLPAAAPQAFQTALDTVRDMGWHVVASVPAEGRIEAYDTTPWFGFRDDIVIRITPAGDRSLLDIRSVSEVGISDVGTNARRIRTFLSKISQGNR